MNMRRGIQGRAALDTGTRAREQRPEGLGLELEVVLLYELPRGIAVLDETVHLGRVDIPLRELGARELRLQLHCCLAYPSAPFGNVSRIGVR